MGQAALALGVAHEARVVHRDVKPPNILIRADGLVKLTDFGIARALDASGHTRHGEMLGTPNYISPEQAMGQAATGASDLYSLGVVAHEMLIGRRPFDRGTPIATALSHVQEPPPELPDDVPEDLRHVIEDCLSKDPELRPPNARAVALRLGLGDQEIIGLGAGAGVVRRSGRRADRPGRDGRAHPRVGAALTQRCPGRLEPVLGEEVEQQRASTPAHARRPPPRPGG